LCKKATQQRAAFFVSCEKIELCLHPFARVYLKFDIGNSLNLGPLVKHRWQGVINSGEQLLGVVIAPQQFGTSQAVDEPRF